MTTADSGFHSAVGAIQDGVARAGMKLVDTMVSGKASGWTTMLAGSAFGRARPMNMPSHTRDRRKSNSTPTAAKASVRHPMSRPTPSSRATSRTPRSMSASARAERIDIGAIGRERKRLITSRAMPVAVPATPQTMTMTMAGTRNAR